MIIKTMKRRTSILLLVAAVFLNLAGISYAAEFWLSADTFTKTMPDSQVMTMWGFARCTDGTYTVCQRATVPGPALTVPPADTSLIVHLKNNLTGPFVEPVSIIIPGLSEATAPQPVWINVTTGSVVPSVGNNRPADVTSRVRSFTHETPVGAIGTYSWNVKPGTYIYQSGTHTALQVQMGLYGMVKNDFAAGQAYSDVSTAYVNEDVLFFSEIDPIIHDAVAANNYGPGKAVQSTITLKPAYFMINGEPFASVRNPIPAGIPGDATLIRFLNAGLKDYVPVMQNARVNLVAEDGNLLPYARNQYSVLLQAGKTKDAVMTAGSAGIIPVYDRRLDLTNGLSSPGGMMTYLNVALDRGDKVGVFRGGTWYLDGDAGGAWSGCWTDFCRTFGLPTDVPLAGDWNGDGRQKMGLKRGNNWLLDYNGNGILDDCATDRCYTFGLATDLPVIGDWDGSGMDKIGVFRSGSWVLDNGNGIMDSCATDLCGTFGTATDIPVAGDWDGSGTDKIGVFRGGSWFLDLNGNRIWNSCATDLCRHFGAVGDIPVVGDWGGTGTSKQGVKRGFSWFLDYNGNGVWNSAADRKYRYGLATDVPVTGLW